MQIVKITDNTKNLEWDNWSSQTDGIQISVLSKELSNICIKLLDEIVETIESFSKPIQKLPFHN